MRNKHLIPKFWSTLFDPGEHGCLSPGETYGANVLGPLVKLTPDTPKYETIGHFAINPLVPGTRRNKANVVAYRNFLVEFDERGTGTFGEDGKEIKEHIPREEQWAAMEASGMPWSTAVWSGGKSYHFVISLDVPLKDEQMYDFVSRWIHKVATLSDPSTIDAARLSRCPGGTYVKPDRNGAVTPTPIELVEVRARVSQKQLRDWLKAHPDCRPTREVVMRYENSQRSSGKIYKSIYSKTPTEAEAYCRDRYPLESGTKNASDCNNLFAWAKYLVSFTGLDRDEMIELIGKNDNGRRPSHREHSRAVDDALSLLSD